MNDANNIKKRYLQLVGQATSLLGEIETNSSYKASISEKCACALATAHKNANAALDDFGTDFVVSSKPQDLKKRYEEHDLHSRLKKFSENMGMLTEILAKEVARVHRMHAAFHEKD